MAACQAVYSTHELIEAVLLELPLFDIATAKEVCTTWREVVRRSSLLTTPEVLSPISRDGIWAGATYKSGASLQLNPSLPHSSRTPLGRPFADAFRYRIVGSPKDARALREAGLQQFATLPPVTCISVSFYWGNGPVEDVKAVVYAKCGVRLGHIESVMRKIESGGGWHVSATIETS